MSFETSMMHVLLSDALEPIVISAKYDLSGDEIASAFLLKDNSADSEGRNHIIFGDRLSHWTNDESVDYVLDSDLGEFAADINCVNTEDRIYEIQLKDRDGQLTGNPITITANKQVANFGISNNNVVITAYDGTKFNIAIDSIVDGLRQELLTRISAEETRAKAVEYTLTVEDARIVAITDSLGARVTQNERDIKETKEDLNEEIVNRKTNQGDLTKLLTPSKDNLVNAINDLSSAMLVAGEGIMVDSSANTINVVRDNTTIKLGSDNKLYTNLDNLTLTYDSASDYVKINAPSMTGKKGKALIVDSAETALIWGEAGLIDDVSYNGVSLAKQKLVELTDIVDSQGVTTGSDWLITSGQVASAINGASIDVKVLNATAGASEISILNTADKKAVLESLDNTVYFDSNGKIQARIKDIVTQNWTSATASSTSSIVDGGTGKATLNYISYWDPASTRLISANGVAGGMDKKTPILVADSSGAYANTIIVTGTDPRDDTWSISAKVNPNALILKTKELDSQGLPSQVNYYAQGSDGVVYEIPIPTTTLSLKNEGDGSDPTDPTSPFATKKFLEDNYQITLSPGTYISLNTAGDTISVDDTQVYNQTEVNDLIAAAGNVKVVSTEPTAPDANTMYYVGPAGTSQDTYYNVLYYDSSKTKYNLGTTRLDLSQYQKKDITGWGGTATQVYTALQELLNGKEATISASNQVDYNTEIKNLPTIGDATITIAENDGTAIGTFKANATSDVTIKMPAGATVGDATLTLQNDASTPVVHGTFTANASTNKTITIPRPKVQNVWNYDKSTSYLSNTADEAVIPNASSSAQGLVKIGTGVQVGTDGTLSTDPVYSTQIDARTERTTTSGTGATWYRPITPDLLDYAVKVALTDGKGSAYTDAQKKAARTRIGANVIDVQNGSGTSLVDTSTEIATIPTATSSTLGLLKVDPTMGTNVETGCVVVKPADQSNLTARTALRSTGYGVVATSNFDAAVKTHLTDGAATAYTDTEKTAASTRILPTISSATSGKLLAVNTSGNGFEWVSAGGSGTVTSVATGAGLTGGPITSAGTIDHKAYTANSAAAKKIGNDAYGHVVIGDALALSDLGVTATATEVNVLDGITATTAELNYVDGVTSSIQTQLDAKATLPTTVKDKYLHTNATTGDLEWSTVVGGATVDGNAVTDILTSSSHPYSSTNRLATLGDVSSAGGGTVTSVRVQAGTGLTSSQSTAQTSTLDTTIGIASGYKLPTDAEFTAKQDQVVAGTGISLGSDNKTINNTGVTSVTQDSTDGHKLTVTTNGTAATITIPDNNTEYTAGTGITVDATAHTITNAGVRSATMTHPSASGYSNVTRLSVDTNGTSSDLDLVKFKDTTTVFWSYDSTNNCYSAEATGGGSGTATSYTTLTNKPQIGGVELSGNKTASDLGLAVANTGTAPIVVNASSQDVSLSYGTGLTVTSDKLVVDTSTIQAKLTAGDGISIASDTVSNSGVRSITQNATDNHILNINTGGTTTSITIPDTDTTYSAGSGISISTANAIGHSNSITAQTTAGLYPFAYDAQGHITTVGTKFDPSTKQDALPTLVNDKYLHVTTAGALEWAAVSAGGGNVDDVQIDGTSIVSSKVANFVTSSSHPYSSTNPIATLADIGAAGGGTVTSVSGGTGLTVTSPTTTPNIAIASGYKLPTTTEWSGKQDTLTAGTNISIASNVISATDTTYSAGTNITIDSSNKISATDTTYTGENGITVSSTNAIGHTNSVTAVTAQALAKVAYDAYGHITGSTAITAAGGLQIDATANTIGHTNSVTAQTTSDFYPITYDAQGHITAAGTALSAGDGISISSSKVSAVLDVSNCPLTFASTGAITIPAATSTSATDGTDGYLTKEDHWTFSQKATVYIQSDTPTAAAEKSIWFVI